MDKLLVWLTLLSAAAAAVSTVSLWGFKTGRWTQRKDGESERVVADVANLRGEVASLRGEVAHMHAALKVEDMARRELAEKTGVNQVRLSKKQAGLALEATLRAEHLDRHMAGIDRRLERVEAITNDLQRQIDRKATTGA